MNWKQKVLAMRLSSYSVSVLWFSVCVSEGAPEPEASSGDVSRRGSQGGCMWAGWGTPVVELQGKLLVQPVQDLDLDCIHKRGQATAKALQHARASEGRR